MRGREPSPLSQTPEEKKIILNRSRLLIFGAVPVIICALLFSEIAWGKGFSTERVLQEDGTPWQITADSLEREGEAYIAEGDVRIWKGAHSLSCQKAVYDPEKGIAEVFGSVRLESGGDLLTGEKGFFNLKDRTARIEKGSLFLKENHFYVRGDFLEKLDDETYRADNITVTTCDGENPPWSINGSELFVVIEGYGTIKHASFRIKDQSIAYIPFMLFPAKIKRQTGFLLPRIGFSSNNGFDFELPFFWAISETADATFYQRYMAERGYMQGLEYRFATDKGNRGMLLFDILSDERTEKNLGDPDELNISPYARTNITRYWLRGRTDTELPAGLNARLDLDYVSDQDYLREFEDSLAGFNWRPDLEEESGRPMEDKRSPTRRSAIRLAGNADDFVVHGTAAYAQVPENPSVDNTAQPLMNLTLLSLPLRLNPAPAFITLDSGYDRVWREEGQDGHRVEVSPFLSVPFWTGPHLEWEPYIRYTYNERWMEEGYGRKEEQYRTAYETGARVSTDLERIYDISWGDATGMMHKISPVLSYRHRELVENWNPKEKKPWFEPIESEGDINKINFSIENFFNGRHVNSKGRKSYQQWATFDVTQGYDLIEAKKPLETGQKRKSFTPLSLELTFTPSSNINLSANASWDHYDESINRAYASLDLYLPRAGGLRDMLKLDYLYRAGIEESLQLESEVNLYYGFSVGGYLQQDFYEDHNISNGFWIRYLDQCWGVRLALENDDIRTRVMLVFELVGLGEIKGRGSIQGE